MTALTRVAAAAAVVVLAGTAGARAEVRLLTLYQKTARAALVVHARALSDSTRRPPLEVVEVLKGSYASRTLYIVPFVQDYGSPKPWLRRETFRKDREYILFLLPFDADDDETDAFERHGEREGEEKEGNPDQRFTCLNANHGALEIPTEGAGALVEAIKRFVAVLSLSQHDDQAEAARGLLWEKNPYLVEAGLAEVARFELALPQDVAPLLEIAASPRGDFRAGALQILGQIGRTAREVGSELTDRQRVFTKIVDRAYNDTDPEVRRIAVRALAGIGGEGTEAILKAVGRNDPDQNVRYEAQIALFEKSGG